MKNKIFRWIAFAITVIFAFIAIGAKTVSGFLCFSAAAFIFIPLNHLFEKLDNELESKYRKRATLITAGIFIFCGLLSFTTTESHLDDENEKITAAVLTTATATTTTETTTTALITTTSTETKKGFLEWLLETSPSTSIQFPMTTETTTTTVIATEAITAAPEPTPIETEPPVVVPDPVEVEPTILHFVLNSDTNCVHINPNCSAAQKILPENYSEIDIPESELYNYYGIYWACGKCSKRYSDELPKF